MAKPTVGIFGLTGCAGDQLAILNCEDELLDIVALIDIRSFVMASSQVDEDCRLDIALVEGAVVTDADEQLLYRIRARADLLIAIGTCAVWGGVPAAVPDDVWPELLLDTYGPAARQYTASRARPLRDVVKVDAAITGCPIEKHEFLGALANLLRGQLPVSAHYPVCTECKMRENECLLVNAGAFCSGPLTAAGCAARCPSLGVPCVGCRGPAVDANYASAAELYRQKGYTPEHIAERLAMFALVPEPALESAVLEMGGVS
ncbi:MAG TPA: hypothetical protein VF021_01100 [Longimicrobiales bacterium]